MNFNGPTSIRHAASLERLYEPTSEEPAGEGPVALLRSLAAVAARNWFGLVLCTAAGLTLAAVYAHSLPRVYWSSAAILLEPRQMSGGPAGRAVQDLDLNRADSELEVIRSERLMSLVFDALDLRHAPELVPPPPGALADLKDRLRAAVADGLAAAGLSQPSAAVAPRTDLGTTDQQAFKTFRDGLSVRRVGQSFVMEVGYSAASPEMAAKVTNAVVSAYLLQAVKVKAETERVSSEVLQGRLNALAAEVEAAEQAVKAGRLPDAPTPDADARIISAALTPLSPSGPRVTLIAALGAVLGLLVGLLVIAVRGIFDRRVRQGRSLARETGLPCLGEFPRVGQHGRRWPDREAASLVVDDPGSRFAAVLRDLRTSIDALCLSVRAERPIIIAFVTLASRGDASAICLNLAQLIWRSGRPVTLVSTAAEQFNATGGGRLTKVTSLAEALAPGTRDDQIAFSEWDGVSVLALKSTNVRANLFADFQNQRTGQILEAACGRGDVLLDLPPLDETADALALAHYADAVVVVATARLTTIDAVAEAVQRLRRAGANVVGTAISGV